MEQSKASVCSKENNSGIINLKEPSKVENIPVHILRNPLSSGSWDSLYDELQQNDIPILHHESLEEIVQLSKNKENKLFIISDSSQKNMVFEEPQNVKLYKFPQTNKELILSSYKTFKNELSSQYDNMLGTGSSFNSKMKGESNLSNSGSKITLKCVSKISHNYKVGWPKKLFIYSNKNDDEQFKSYIEAIKDRSFKNVEFINSIEGYIKALPKSDKIYCVLFSQYSAVNLKKYFRQVDEFMLLGAQNEQCLPLLRGKMHFFTTQIKVLDDFLTKKFNMKEINEKKEIRPSSTKKENETEKKQPQVKKVKRSILKKTSIFECEKDSNNPSEGDQSLVFSDKINEELMPIKPSQKSCFYLLKLSEQALESEVILKQKTTASIVAQNTEFYEEFQDEKISSNIFNPLNNLPIEEVSQIKCLHKEEEMMATGSYSKQNTESIRQRSKNANKRILDRMRERKKNKARIHIE